MDLIGSLLVYLVGAYIPLTVAAYRFMVLADAEARWRALVPVWNLLILFDLGGQSRLSVLLLFIPLLNFFVLSWLLGEVATRVGRPPWVGWLAGIPGIHIIGLPVFALTASKFTPQPTDPRL